MDKELERQIEACRKLGMTDEEIKEMLDDDKAIDRSGTSSKVFDWELDPEEHKKAVKYANSDEKKNKGDKKKPTRKADNVKREIIQLLFDCIDVNYPGAVVDNPEKYIKFTIGEDEYTISLIKHRKPKD